MKIWAWLLYEHVSLQAWMTLKTAGRPGNPGNRTLKDYLDECRVLEYQKPDPIIIKDDSTPSAGAWKPDVVIIPDKAPDTRNCPIPRKEQYDEDTGDECR